MKKKKGFTLIELLAVIVVLAVLMVIAVPKILDVIENADKQAYKESVELMAHTAQIQYQTKEVTGTANKIPDEGIKYYYYNNKQVKSLKDDEKEIEITKSDDNYLDFKGDKPLSGTITLTKNKKVILDKIVSKNEKWCAIKEENEKQARVGRATDPDFACIVEEDKPIVDKQSCFLEKGEDELVGEVYKKVYYIDSPSDLYKLSQDINSGVDYSGKIVRVRNDLDMSDTSETCGDDSFKPIGYSSEYAFNGTFDGGAKVIKNLTINTLTDDNSKNDNNVGLFGYVKGTEDNEANIYGIRIINDVDSDNNPKGSITGNEKVGGLAGYVNKYSNIKEIELDNIKVVGKSKNVGGAVGGLYNSSSVEINNILVKNGSVEGYSNVGYLSGGGASAITESVVEKVDLTYTFPGTTNIYTTNSSNNSYHSNLSTINSSEAPDGYNSNGIDDINFYEAVGLDTWIGGDNDTKGYYFDYDENNKIILKNTNTNPITFNLSKDSEENYLINNEKEWKIASSRPKEKYKIINNLDFSENKYYMLGSVHDNYFSGTLNGNDKTISNVTINGNKDEYLGMIGYVNSGTIYGLTLKNIEINGYDKVGIFGYVKGIEDKEANIYGIRIVNEVDSDNNPKVNITGNGYVGGLAGYVYKYSNIKEIELDNIKVVGESKYIGGAVGGSYNGTSVDMNNVLIKNGSVKGYSNVGYLEGGSINAITDSIVEKVDLIYTFPGTTNISTTSKTYNSYHSNLSTVNDTVAPDGYDSSNIDNIYYYKNVLETLFTGDENSTGYFFDLMDDGKIHLRTSYIENPVIDEETGETIKPGVCSKYPCTCECGCDCGPSNGELATRCQEGCNSQQ